MIVKCSHSTLMFSVRCTRRVWRCLYVLLSSPWLTQERKSLDTTLFADKSEGKCLNLQHSLPLYSFSASGTAKTGHGGQFFRQRGGKACEQICVM